MKPTSSLPKPAIQRENWASMCKNKHYLLLHAGNWNCTLVHEYALTMVSCLQHHVTCVGIQICYQVNCGFIYRSENCMKSTLPWLGFVPPQRLHWLCNETESKFSEKRYLPPSWIPQTWNPKWHGFSGRIFPPGEGSLTMSSWTSCIISGLYKWNASTVSWVSPVINE